MRTQGFSSSELLSPQEQALLVGVELEKEKIPSELSLAELGRLAGTAGARVVGQISQKKNRPDPRFFIGPGKITEVKEKALALGANLIIFDHELSPGQIRNVTEELNLKVIDRTQLILDIFAQHAQSREGKLQVELAQYSYNLSHLTGHGIALSRLGGGIGTRGPGETKLEYDRRFIRSRISQLKKEIDKLSDERLRQRESRRRKQLPLVALVGYTNAGKSTLLNQMTGAAVLTENKLFATLDPTTRRLYLPSQRMALLTDTVGFIQKLPHTLVAAFHATLEEVAEADLLLHVVDFSSNYWERQINAVYEVLEELKCITRPILTVFNKSDAVTKKISPALLKRYQPAVTVSALREEGLEELLAKIDALLPGLPPPIPASKH